MTNKLLATLMVSAATTCMGASTEQPPSSTRAGSTQATEQVPSTSQQGSPTQRRWDVTSALNPLNMFRRSTSVTSIPSTDEDGTSSEEEAKKGAEDEQRLLASPTAERIALQEANSPTRPSTGMLSSMRESSVHQLLQQSSPTSALVTDPHFSPPVHSGKEEVTAKKAEGEARPEEKEEADRVAKEEAERLVQEKARAAGSKDVNSYLGRKKLGL